MTELDWAVDSALSTTDVLTWVTVLDWRVDSLVSTTAVFISVVVLDWTTVLFSLLTSTLAVCCWIVELVWIEASVLSAVATIDSFDSIASDYEYFFD